MTNQTEQLEREELIQRLASIQNKMICIPRLFDADEVADIGGAAALLAADNIPPAPVECKTEEEKRAYAYGWWKALETKRLAADKAGGEEAALFWYRPRS